MGSLTLPSSGAVLVDSSALIYSVERHPQFGPLITPLWQAAQAGLLEVVACELRGAREKVARPVTQST